MMDDNRTDSMYRVYEGGQEERSIPRDVYSVVPRISSRVRELASNLLAPIDNSVGRASLKVERPAKTSYAARKQIPRREGSRTEAGERREGRKGEGNNFYLMLRKNVSRDKSAWLYYPLYFFRREIEWRTITLG